jgi:predicted nucleotidyltransferase
MVSGEIIEQAGKRLAAAARQPARVLLFGSHARGDAGPDSDLDFLVIERDVPNRHAEMVRCGGVGRREEHGRPRRADRGSRVCRGVTGATSRGARVA